MIRLILLLALLSACASAPKHPEGGYGEPLLWQLADEDTTIHIFGTVHALPSELEWRTPSFEAAFGAADSFCVETDVDAKADEYREYLREYGYFNNGETLSNYLTEEQIEDVVEVADAVGLPFETIDAMKPWNAMFELSTAVVIHLGLDQLSGVEFVLLPEARKAGKNICEMESPLESVTSISRLPLDVQVAVLTHESEDFKDIDDLDIAFEMIREDIAEMVKTWVTGDLSVMENENILDEYGHMDFYDAILTKRNTKWIPRIEALLEQPGTKFVAVGSAHLAGPNSVIKMLRDNGHAVAGP